MSALVTKKTFMTVIKNFLTIDVEDWFHILDLKDGVAPAEYDIMDSLVEVNTEKILQILDEYDTKGTFFVVGWVAKKFPGLVRRIFEEGHEIASHSYNHTLSNEMTQGEFKEDVQRSIEILEDVTGEKVYGFRSPGMSIKKNNLWALDILIDLGIRYDSSIYPGTSGHGGLPGASKYPYWQSTPTGKKIFEIPSSCFNFMGKNIGFAGGGYLRLFPYSLIKYWMNQYNREGHPVNVYMHPREVDPTHPRLKMPLVRKFKSYVNLHSAEKKLRSLLKEYNFGRIKDILDCAD